MRERMGGGRWVSEGIVGVVRLDMLLGMVVGHNLVL